jgi:protein tyrosine/serine phosphatase
LALAGIRIGLGLCLCIGQAPAASQAPAARDVRNFHQVDEHIFRGAQPTLLGLQELGALGIKQVIDLREPGPGTTFEKEQAKKLGIKYINIPLPELSAPADDQIQTVLKLLASKDVPTFVHCRRGKDRTGTVIACYRVQHYGWDNQKALREARLNGMSSFERGMQHYILHFTPLKTPELLSTSTR